MNAVAGATLPVARPISLTPYPQADKSYRSLRDSLSRRFVRCRVMPDETKSPASPPPEGEPKPAAAAPAAVAPAKPAAPAKPPAPTPVPWDSPMIAKLKGNYGSGLEALTYAGQNYMVVDRSLIPEILQVLRNEEEFDYCVDITAVHYPAREKQFDVVWVLY